MNGKQVHSARRPKGGPIFRPLAAKAKPARRRAKAKAVLRASVTPEERWQTIACAAYCRAEARGFAPGGDLQDWLNAEAEVEAACGGARSSQGEHDPGKRRQR